MLMNKFRLSSSQILRIAAAAIMSLCAVQAVATTKYLPLRFREFAYDGIPYGLVEDAQGNLYGVATGGSSNAGTVFRAVADSQGNLTQTVLYDFTGGLDGGFPAGIVLDAAGNIYGLTSDGGTYGYGVFFELTPTDHGPWKESVLYSLTEIRGNPIPNGPSTDGAGNFFGQTYEWGGVGYGCGYVFKLSKSTIGVWTYDQIYTFGCEADGGAPFGPFVFDKAGNLYGTGELGGSLKGGVVFELTPSTGGPWSESVVYNFAGGEDGSFPGSGLIVDTSGNLYGTTGSGGSTAGCGLYGGCGTVFELSPSSDGTWTESVLYSFGNTEPLGNVGPSGLAMDNIGNLFGTTYGGGAGRSCYNGCGTAFEVSPSGDGQWTGSILHNFTGIPGGYNPFGVVVNRGGRLYGTTGLGGTGAGFNGTVFELGGKRN